MLACYDVTAHSQVRFCCNSVQSSFRTAGSQLCKSTAFTPTVTVASVLLTPTSSQASHGQMSVPVIAGSVGHSHSPECLVATLAEARCGSQPSDALSGADRSGTASCQLSIDTHRCTVTGLGSSGARHPSELVVYILQVLALAPHGVATGITVTMLDARQSSRGPAQAQHQHNFAYHSHSASCTTSYPWPPYWLSRGSINASHKHCASCT
jgi:hypothetical protein